MRLCPAARAIGVLSALICSGLFLSCGGGSTPQGGGGGTAKLTQITIAPSNPTITKGASQQLAATGSFDDGTQRALGASVTWQTSQSTVATVNTQGSITGVGEGVAQVSAAYQGVTGSTSVTVGPPGLLSITVTPNQSSLPVGESEQLTATGNLSDGTTQNLTQSATWSSSAPGVAPITAGGLATGVTTGTSSISATMSSITGSTALTVTAPVLVSIAVTPASASVAAGQTTQFTATGTFTDNTKRDVTNSVTWTSSSPSIATISSIGVATGKTSGSATVTATIGSISGSAALTVSPAVVVSISVSPAFSSLPLGESAQFSAMATYSDGTKGDVTSSANWSSSAAGIAPIDANGLAKGLALGTTTITASVSSINGSAALTVTSAQVVAIAVTPANSSVPAGKSEQLAAVAAYSDGSTRDATASVIWNSSAPGVAIVSPGGLTTGVAVGTAAISASLGAVTGSALLSVSAAVPVSIALAPSASDLMVAESEQLVATATFSDGTVSDVSSSAGWSSSATAIATVDASGNVSGIGIGTVTITATLGTLSASATVNVFIPDATVRVSNPGTADETNLCAMIYVFDNNRQLAECCGCLTMPNGLRTLSVQNDLTSNPLTGKTLVSGSIKVVSAAVNASPCDPTSNVTPVPSLRAWATHIQDHQAGGYPITESDFTDATLSDTELTNLQANCYFVNRLGSDRGTCTCGSGD
jgi:uncharacterized protein YjdB